MQSATLSNAATDEIGTLLQQAVEHHAVPGVVAIVANRETVLYRGTVDASPTALYRIASMTKPVTSVAIMMLRERGLLDLDDPLERYLPVFAGRAVMQDFNAADASFGQRPASGPITLRHLLAHTAGFGYTFCHPILFALEQRGITVSRTLPTLPLLHDPGSQWTYSSATAILGEVIEQITGEPFYTFLQTQILQPLGMFDTGYFLKPEDGARLMPLYTRVDGQLRPEPQPKPYKPYLLADGGLVGTADDYIRFIQMLLNRGQLGPIRLLTEQSVREMTCNQIGKLTVETQPGLDPDVACSFPLGAGIDKFGLGFQITETVGEHSRSQGSYSWGGIYNTHFWGDPQMGIGALLFTQLLPYYDEACIQLLGDFEACVYKNLVSH